ncbi:hypothetical protein H9P43_001040 [Blastocladiella emersonii ATCC 22665]|nr:hypothetical protein H9P43_001040 [Blastocladiella emersonii ATCC 22665]
MYSTAPTGQWRAAPASWADVAQVAPPSMPAAPYAMPAMPAMPLPPVAPSAPPSNRPADMLSRGWPSRCNSYAANLLFLRGLPTKPSERANVLTEALRHMTHKSSKATIRSVFGRPVVVLSVDRDLDSTLRLRGFAFRSTYVPVVDVTDPERENGIAELYLTGPTGALPRDVILADLNAMFNNFAAIVSMAKRPGDDERTVLSVVVDRVGYADSVAADPGMTVDTKSCTLRAWPMTTNIDQALRDERDATLLLHAVPDKTPIRDLLSLLGGAHPALYGNYVDAPFDPAVPLRTARVIFKTPNAVTEALAAADHIRVAEYAVFLTRFGDTACYACGSPDHPARSCDAPEERRLNNLPRPDYFPPPSPGFTPAPEFSAVADLPLAPSVAKAAAAAAVRAPTPGADSDWENLSDAAKSKAASPVKPAKVAEAVRAPSPAAVKPAPVSARAPTPAAPSDDAARALTPEPKSEVEVEVSEDDSLQGSAKGSKSKVRPPPRLPVPPKPYTKTMYSVLGGPSSDEEDEGEGDDDMDVDDAATSQGGSESEESSSESEPESEPEYESPDEEDPYVREPLPAVRIALDANLAAYSTRLGQILLKSTSPLTPLTQAAVHQTKAQLFLAQAATYLGLKDTAASHEKRADDTITSSVEARLSAPLDMLSVE